MTGSLNVLNVGAGDIKLVFNQADSREAKKAIKMLTDMRDRGYAIMIELPDGSYTRATEIDASRGRYVITLPEDMELPPEAEVVPTKGKNGRRNGSRKVSVPVARTRAHGIARSAGG
jgi:hypothetical protein